MVNKKLRVLVGCEESGKVRDAFARLGHDAWSNDLVPARNGGKHLQICVREAMANHGPWDIIIIHPDCTAMAVSGNRWYGAGMPFNNQREDAIAWTTITWEMAKENAAVGCAIENPVSVLWENIPDKVHYIQPWQFGHGETKKTGIATYGLPPLQPTQIVDGREQRVWKMPPGKNRKRDCSETYQGIADAMAEQWGGG